MSDPTALVAELEKRARGLEKALRAPTGADLVEANMMRRAAALIAQQAASIEVAKAGWRDAEAALTAAEAERDRLVAEEREACAKLASDLAIAQPVYGAFRAEYCDGHSDGSDAAQAAIAQAIRARAALSTAKEKAREAAVQKANLVLRQWAAFFNDDSARQSAKEIIDLLAALSAAEGEAEPVARVTIEEIGPVCKFFTEVEGRLAALGIGTHDLYARPPSEPAGVKVSAHEIEQIINTHVRARVDFPSDLTAVTILGKDTAASAIAACLRSSHQPDTQAHGGDEISTQRALAHEEIANDVLGWLKERGLYDPRDYEHEGPNVAEILTEHEEELLKPRDPRSAEDVLRDLTGQAHGGRVEAVARRAKYLLSRMENDDGIGIGEIDTLLRMAAALAASPSAPAAAGVELDLERVAKSLASMLIEYVEGGISSNQNWRNGLNEIILARLRRLASPAPDAKER